MSSTRDWYPTHGQDNSLLPNQPTKACQGAHGREPLVKGFSYLYSVLPGNRGGLCQGPTDTVTGTATGSRRTGVCCNSRTPGPGAAAATAGPPAWLPGLGCWTQPTYWRTEAAEAEAADLGQLEPDLQVAGLSLGTVLALVDLLGLKVLKVVLWGLAEAAVLAPAGLSLGYAGPEHLSSPVGRNGLGYGPQGQAVWDDWGRFADKEVGRQNGTGCTFLQGRPKSYLVSSLGLLESRPDYWGDLPYYWTVPRWCLRVAPTCLLCPQHGY